MTQSVENKIKNKVQGYKRGKIFFPIDFEELGSNSALRQGLNRLAKKGFILRIANGIYLYPKKHELFGDLMPTPDEIAKAIAKRDKARLIPTGPQALNALGFSTQVPLKSVFMTDGSPRQVEVGNYVIKFKKARPKLLALKNEKSVLAVQALAEIGQSKINNDILLRIERFLNDTPAEDLKHDAKLAPAWIAEILQDILKSKSSEGVS